MITMVKSYLKIRLTFARAPCICGWNWKVNTARDFCVKLSVFCEVHNDRKQERRESVWHHSLTPFLEKAIPPARIEQLSELKKPKFDPGFEPGLLGQKVFALPLAPPPRPICKFTLYAPGASRHERRHDQVHLRRSPSQLPQGHRLLRRRREAGRGKAQRGRNSDRFGWSLSFSGHWKLTFSSTFSPRWRCMYPCAPRLPLRLCDYQWSSRSL